MKRSSWRRPLDRNAYSRREIQWYEKITAPHELLVNARVRRLHGGVNLAAFLSLFSASRSVRPRPSERTSGYLDGFCDGGGGRRALRRLVGWLLVNAIDLIAPSANGKRCLFCASLLPSLSCLLFGWRSHELWAGKERTGQGPLWLDRKNTAPLARKQLSKVTRAQIM